MEDQTAQFSETEGDELPGVATVTDEPQENNAPGYLTEERFMELMAVERQKFAEESARAFRAKQSMVDKNARRVAAEAQKTLQALKESGGTFTPEAEQSFVNRAVNQYMESVSDEATEPAQERSSDANQNPQADYLAKRMERITKKANGLIVTDKDPEGEVLLDAWKKVQSGGDPDDFIELYESQLSKKARREGTPAQARVASIASGGAGYQKTADTLNAELAKLLEHPNPKDLKKIEDIQEKLKKMN